MEVSVEDKKSDKFLPNDLTTVQNPFLLIA
jgi:hypothetical protein